MKKARSRVALSTPERLAAMLADRGDAEVEQEVRKLGVDAALETCFAWMAQRFLPERARGERAVIQWRLETPEGMRSYVVRVGDGRCETKSGEVRAPRVTLEANLPVFLRIVAGRLNGLQAFARGQLRVTGDVVVALWQQTWFAVDLSGARLDISTPGELSRLIGGLGDDEIIAGVALTGANQALDQVFAGMVDRFLPHKAGSSSVVVEFRIHTPEAEHAYQFRTDAGRPRYVRGTPDRPRVTLALSLPNFLRMIAGQLDGVTAFVTGRVRIRGNLLVARSFQYWFNRSG